MITRSQYLVTKHEFLLQRLTEFLPEKYNFYTGDLVICLDHANIIQGMKRLQAYKFRIEPTGEQQRAMRRIAGTCRFDEQIGLRHGSGTRALEEPDESAPTVPATPPHATPTPPTK